MNFIFAVNWFVLFGFANCQILHLNQTLEEQIVESQVPPYLKILASVFYTISMILGIGGNAFVLLIFMFYQRVKTVTNFFIINLAINDLLFALLCIPSTFITAYLIEYWPMPQFMCVFLNFMQNASVTLTVYTLIWITLDKFWALVMPLRERISITLCKYLIFASWLFSLFTSLPIAMFTKLTMVNSSDSKPQCSEIWPQNLEQWSTIYNVFMLLIQYFVPLIILTYCYAKIGLVLRKSKAPGETDLNRDARMTKSKQKILKMSFMMVLTFMIFWAPLHFLNLYRFLDDSINYTEHIGDIFFICHLLAVSRSFVNPFIYAWINPKFRRALRYFLLCYCFDKNEKNKFKYSNQKYLLTNLNNCADSFQNNKRHSVVSSATKSNHNSFRRSQKNIYLNSNQKSNQNDLFESNHALETPLNFKF